MKMSVDIKHAALISVLIASAAGLAVINPIQDNIDQCTESGGNVTTYGEKMYCEYDNGSGSPLGTNEAPHELDRPPKTDLRPGDILMVLPYAVAISAGVVCLAVAKRWYS